MDRIEIYRADGTLLKAETIVEKPGQSYYGLLMWTLVNIRDASDEFGNVNISQEDGVIRIRPAVLAIPDHK